MSITSSQQTPICNFLQRSTPLIIFLSLLLHIIFADEATFLNTLNEGNVGPEWGFSRYASAGLTKSGWVYYPDSPGNGYFEVCDTDVKKADNWLFSSYIEINPPPHVEAASQHSHPGPAKMIDIKILFAQKDCRNTSANSQGCSNVVHVKYWETEKSRLAVSANEIAASRDQFVDLGTLDTTADPFNFINTSHTKEPNKMGSKFFKIQIPQTRNIQGIVLAFKDAQSCTYITEVEVHSKYCPAMEMSLGEYPVTWVADVPRKRRGKCVQGAVAPYDPQAYCSATGMWDLDGTLSKFCHCVAGREPSSDFSHCTACGLNQYKGSPGNAKCQHCPKNSVTHGTANSACVCVHDYHRGLNDSLDSDCEKAPNAPLHLEARVINTDVQLLWSPPKLPMGYTRTNIWYIVQCKDCPRNNAAFGSDGLSKSLRLSDLPFHVKGLRPETRYQFEVFSMNSITENSLSLADYEVAIVTTQKEVKIINLRVERSASGDGSIIVTWSLSGGSPGGLVGGSPGASAVHYQISLFAPDGHENEIYTTTESYKLQGLSSGQWKFKVCTESEFPVCSDTIELSITSDQVAFASMSPRNLAIAAGLLIAIILTMLLVLIMAVCCYRRNIALKWPQAVDGYTPGTLAGMHGLGGQYNMMDVNVSFDNSTTKFLYGAGYPGQQAFVDPTYFDDVDKILSEFTREIMANQLQGFEECFGNPHSISSPPNSDLQQNNNLEDLGAGSMGVCGNEYRAVLFHSENQKSSVRLRSCDESNLNDLKLFAIEAATMSQFYHPNVLMIHGVVYEGPRVFMCVEDNPLSSLDLYLKAAFASTPDSGGMGAPGGGLSQIQLVHLLRGVACGMQYLTELGYVHKVLCASNILVSTSGLCKIAGFDMHVLLEEQENQGTSSKIVDSLTGWLAPEVLAYRKWSSASDVWAFGTLAWETLSHCQVQPMPGSKPSQEIVKSLETGHRLPLPDGVSPFLYESLMMGGCWRMDRSQRLSFGQLRECLESAIRNPNQLHPDLYSTNNAKTYNPYYPSTYSTIAQNKMKGAPPPNAAAKYGGTGGGGGGGCLPNTGLAMGAPVVQHNTYTLPPTSTGGVPSGTPLSIMSPVQDWLQSLKLEQYIPLFTSNDYLTLEDIVSLENRSLEILGVSSAKHRKQLMNSIESLRAQHSNLKQAAANAANMIWSKDSAVHVIM